MAPAQPVQGSYTWDDSDGVISVHIPIGDIDKKDVEVKITSTWMKAGPKKKEPIITGKLFQGVNADDSIWQIERATKTLTIHLEKDAGISWPILIVGPGPAPADSVDAQSLYYLGEAFEQGRGYSLPADGAQALLHYVKSAEKDFLPALVRLARAYTPDAAPAALLNPGSGGVSYGNSLDAIERNASTARHYYTKAAELGSPEAQAALAWSLLHPAMLAGSWESDRAAARDWAEKSALAGCAEGCYVLGLCYEADASTAQLAVENFKKAGPGHAAAMHSLAWHQLRGSGGLQADAVKAGALFRGANQLDSRLRIPSETEMRHAVRQGGSIGGVPLDLVLVAVGGLAILGGIWYLRSKKNS